MNQFNCSEKINIGISQCLLGHKVRYDGDHQHSPLCTERLAAQFNFVGICPEMGIGMSAPREPIRLQGALHHRAVCAVGKHNAAVDVTQALTQYAQEKSAELAHLSGYIFMSRSPSCAIDSAKVYDENNQLLARRSAGVYASAFIGLHPLIPVEEESRLHDEKILENFVTRVYAWQRWNNLMRAEVTPAALQDFHARHKYLVMAHSPAAYQHLGRLVAGLCRSQNQAALLQVAQDYAPVFMAALKTNCTPKGHANVLQHLLGYFKKHLNAAEKHTITALIDDYRVGRVPLHEPMTALKKCLEKHPNAYLQHQVYFDAAPSRIRY